MFLVNYIISTTIMTFFSLLIASKIQELKINFKNKKVIIGIILLFIATSFINYYFKDFIKTIFISSIMIIVLKLIFNQNLNQSVITSVFIFICYFIAEIIYGVLFILILRIDINVLTSDSMFIFNNFFLSLFSYLISLIPLFKNIYKKTINNIKNNEYLILFLVFVTAIGIFGNKQGNANNFFELLSNYLLILIFVITIYFLVKERIRSEKTKERYDQLFNYIEKYEKELNKKNLLIHEFKNQIIVIKGLSNTNNNKLQEYLETIIKDVKKVDLFNISEMENVPSGGLKGLLYYKLGDIEETGIKIFMKINSNTIKSPFNKIPTELYKDILKILGIYIDNAIEASRDSRNKEIIIEMFYEKRKFHFIISNNYKNNVDFDKVYEIGYSTKGKNRGYGLAIAKSIINKNGFISEKREITDQYHTQELVIDFKSILN